MVYQSWKHSWNMSNTTILDEYKNSLSELLTKKAKDDIFKIEKQGNLTHWGVTIEKRKIMRTHYIAPMRYQKH